MNVIPAIAENMQELKQLLQAVHAFSERRHEGIQVADLIASKLESWGLSVHRGVGKRGVVGVLRRGLQAASIGLRAHMDALSVEEVSQFAHRSAQGGHIHTCGHDGDIAMLLGAARHLALHEAFNGTVVFIFQPAEEGSSGAQAMIDDGLFERFPVDAIYALHNWPGLETGRFGVTSGPSTAASAEFRISVSGVGSHAALPHLGRDPLFAASQIYQTLQGLLNRIKQPRDNAVLTVSQFHSGEKDNAVADNAWLSGTFRAFDSVLVDEVEHRLRDIAEWTAAAHGCKATTHFKQSYPAIVNDPEQTSFAASVMCEIVGSANVDQNIAPQATGEDFAFMLRAKPGCYAFLGNGEGARRSDGHGDGPCFLHTSSYDLNDALLPIGASYWVRLVERFLSY
jgi:amidohydrolase